MKACTNNVKDFITESEIPANAESWASGVAYLSAATKVQESIDNKIFDAGKDGFIERIQNACINTSEMKRLKKCERFDVDVMSVLEILRNLVPQLEPPLDS